ncbi:uncharacterized protein LOC121861427 isoform X1 [Homarus americanus]|uniref:Putative DM4/DM12 family-like protein 21 n=1 Tax=Homarus americanus TaxID=6706 RepID=A0A8J5TIC5_HOMAM|nr:uncharacterized protein LOC121861427 isoform X1 [Homarus americanus]KAG7172638.1 putative DM4/DM12 family-like protein 21 [Homarus americanus]
MMKVTSPSWRLMMVLLATFAAAAAESTASSVESLLGSALGSDTVRQGVSWSNSLEKEEMLRDTKNNRSTKGVGHQRVKRQLIDFADNAVMEFYFRLVVPYWTLPNVKTRGDYRLEVTYELPNQLLRRRKKRSLVNERSALYSLLGDFLSKAGLDGEECVLRAVCEVGEAPLEEYGILGEFINLIFAPGFQGDEFHRDHIQAEEYGRSYGNCWSAFPDCPMSLREMLHEFFLNNAEVPTENGT